MRTITTPSRRSSAHRGEDGAVIITVALAIFVLLGSAMIAVDAGNLWQTRRNLITATDATALGVAAAAAQGEVGAGDCVASQWVGLLADNAGSDVTLKSCTVVANSNGTGYVVVEAVKPGALFFARVFGFGQTSDVYSMTAARFAHKVGGMRPIGICDKNPTLMQALADWDAKKTEEGPQATHTVTFFYDMDGPNACYTSADGASTPGVWGFLFYAGGSQSEAQLIEWFKNGYNPDEIPAEWWIPARTSTAGGNLQQVLNTLVQNDTEFSISLYDEIKTDQGGGGANFMIRIKDIVGVKLVDYRVTGAESQRYFTFEFRTIVAAGQWTDQTFGVLGVGICAVDSDPSDVDVGDRCLS